MNDASSRPAEVVGSDRLRRAVRHERRVLIGADAILRCVVIALEYEDWSSDEPDYAEAIGVVRHLISQSVERLESHADSPTARSVQPAPEGST